MSASCLHTAGALSEMLNRCMSVITADDTWWLSNFLWCNRRETKLSVFLRTKLVLDAIVHKGLSWSAMSINETYFCLLKSAYVLLSTFLHFAKWVTGAGTIISPPYFILIFQSCFQNVIFEYFIVHYQKQKYSNYNGNNWPWEWD